MRNQERLHSANPARVLASGVPARRPMMEALEPRLLLSNADWTVMVYMSADGYYASGNSMDASALVDINEMESVGSTAQVKVVAQLDGSPKGVASGGWTDTRRGLIVHDDNTSAVSSTFSSQGELDMGNAATLTEFIQYAKSVAPADHYMLVLWDHGDGLKGVCEDSTSQSILSVADVRTAIAASGTHLDILAADACLMGSLEVAYEWRGSADYLMVSEEVIPEYGYPYDSILQDINNGYGTGKVAPADWVVQRSVSDYAISYADMNYGIHATTLSGINLSKMGNLGSAMNSLGTLLGSSPSEWQNVYWASVFSHNYYNLGLLDMGTFLSTLVNTANESNVKNAASSALGFFNSAVIANYSGLGENATGLSFHLPREGMPLDGAYRPANFQFLTDAPQWYSFMQGYATNPITTFPVSTSNMIWGMAVGVDGTVWLGEQNPNTQASLLGIITTDGHLKEVPTDIYGYIYGSGIMAVGADGNLYTGYGANINVFNTAGQLVTSYALSDDPLAWVSSVTASGDGSMWFVLNKGGLSWIGRITPEHQIMKSGLAAYCGGGNGGVFMTVAPDGTAWYVVDYYFPGDRSDLRFGHVTLSGQVTERTLIETPHYFYATGITVGSDGNIWLTANDNVGSTYTPKIGRVAPDGAPTWFAYSTAGEAAPVGIVAGGDGNLWFLTNVYDVSYHGTWFLGRITPLGLMTFFYPTVLSGDWLQTSICPVADGSVWLSQSMQSGSEGNYYATSNLMRVNLPTDLTVTIDQAASQTDPTTGSTVHFTVVFDRPVLDFDASDVRLEESSAPGSLVTTVTDSGDHMTYDVQVHNMAGNGYIIAYIPAAAAHDQFGVGNLLSTSKDNIVSYRPVGAASVTINQAATQDDPTANKPVHFTTVFSKAMVDFTAGCVTLSGTAPGAMYAVVTDSGDHKSYDVAVNGMTGNGTVIAVINADVAHDAQGNPNLAATSADNTIYYQAVFIPPLYVTVEQEATQVDPATTSPIRFAVTFTVAVPFFSKWNVTLGGTAPGAQVSSLVDSGDHMHFHLAVSGMTGSGTVTMTVPAGSVWDSYGTSNSASTSVDNLVAFDASGPPTVTLNQADGTADPTGVAVQFTAVFSKPVTDFATGDVTLGGTAPGTLVAAVTDSGDHMNYTINVTGMTGSGTVTASIAAGAAHDAGSQASTASVSIDNSVSYQYLPITEYSTGITANGSPLGICAGPGGNVWFTETNGNRIARVTPAGVVTEFSTGIPSGASPYEIALGGDGNLWFTCQSLAQIGRITPTGTVTMFSSGITGTMLRGIAAGADGNLWFAEQSGRIGRITTAGAVTEFSAGLGQYADPTAITAGPDGNLWFTEWYAGRIGRITTAGTITEFSQGLKQNNGLQGIVAGPDGNLWFTQGNLMSSPAIGRITPTGQITLFSAGLGSMNNPSGIAAGADGNLWFTEQYPNRIGRITTTGTIVEFAAPASPRDIVALSDGGLWFTEPNGRLARAQVAIRLPGDVNNDGLVNASDIDDESAAVRYGSTDNSYDLNNDGAVNHADVDELVTKVLHTVYGDATMDGVVDGLDFQRLLNNWNTPGTFGWADGNFNGNIDDQVEGLDFQILLNNWGFGIGGTGLAKSPATTTTATATTTTASADADLTAAAANLAPASTVAPLAADAGQADPGMVVLIPPLGLPSLLESAPASAPEGGSARSILTADLLAAGVTSAPSLYALSASSAARWNLSSRTDVSSASEDGMADLLTQLTAPLLSRL